MALFSLGCGSDVASDELADGSVGTNQEQLAAGHFTDASGNLLWTAWTMPINVCFTRAASTDEGKYKDASGVYQYLYKGKTLSVGHYAEMKPIVMTTLSQTWALVPGISFVNAGECTSSMPNHLHVNLTPGGFQSGWCGGGRGATCEMRSPLLLPSETPAGAAPQFTSASMDTGLPQVVSHEVGHALGFAHESQRNDLNPVSCKAAELAACQRCKTAIDGGAPCLVADYNGCFPSIPEMTDQTFAVTSQTYQNLLSAIANDAAINNLELLTQYDPLSIMSYCATTLGRNGQDPMPTRLDLLGAEMTYPLATGHKLGCKQGCFHTSSGAITRTDGFLRTDWAERGALNSDILWGGQSAPTLSAAGLPQGTSTLSYTFLGPRPVPNPPAAPARPVLTAFGTLVNSSSVYAAVNTTVMPVL